MIQWLLCQALALMPHPHLDAIAYVESRNQNLLDWDACVGKHQVCSSWTSEKYGVKRWMLWDPAINRTMAMIAWKRWMRRSHGDVFAAARAYNCGGGGLKGLCGAEYEVKFRRALRAQGVL